VHRWSLAPFVLAVALVGLAGCGVHQPSAESPTPSVTTKAARENWRAVEDQAQKALSDVDARSLPLAQRALDLVQAQSAPDIRELAESLDTLGDACGNPLTMCRLDAKDLFSRSLRIRETAFGSTSVELAPSLDRLANYAISSQGLNAKMERSAGLVLLRPPEAMDPAPLVRRALEFRTAALGPIHADTIAAMKRFAHFYEVYDQAAAADPLRRQLLTLAEASNDRAQLDEALQWLAFNLQLQNQFAEAEPFWRRAIAIEEAAVGPNNPGLGSAYAGLAWTYAGEHDVKRAEGAYEHAVDLMREPPSDSLITFKLVDCLDALTDLYMSEGRPADAEKRAVRALGLEEKEKGVGSARLKQRLERLAKIEVTLGRDAEAAAITHRAESLPGVPTM
jgi:tetratricopeptide (TPR) repeat protein